MPLQSISRRSVIIGAAGAGAACVGLTPTSLAQTSATGSARNRPFDVARFVDDVKRAKRESDGQKAVEDVLRRAVARPRAVLAALGESVEAGIHPIYRDDEVTILNVVWAPLMVLLPHNHNMWASIAIYSGREDNILWQRRGDVVTAASAASLSEKQVFGLGADAVHSVTNPIRRLTGAIHIYGGDFFAPGRSEWDAETLKRRPWDLDAAREEFRKAVERFESVP